jgi:hypothetical protein
VSPLTLQAFFVLVYMALGGRKRLHEVGHFIKKTTKKQSCDVVTVDTKRGGYNHNVLLPRALQGHP